MTSVVKFLSARTYEWITLCEMQHTEWQCNLPKFLFRLLSTLDWDPHLTVLFFSSHSSKLEKANSFSRATTEYEYIKL